MSNCRLKGLTSYSIPSAIPSAVALLFHFINGRMTDHMVGSLSDKEGSR